MELCEIKNFCTSKENISKMKREPTIEENIFADDLFNYFLKICRFSSYHIFSDYKTHWTIRHTQVLEEENREKKTLSTATPLPSPPHAQVHLDYKTHPPFPPKFGGGKCILQSEKYDICLLLMFVVLKLQNMPCLITMPRNYSRFVLWHNIVLKFVYTQSYIYVYKMCVCMSVYICIYLHTHINKIQKTHIKKFLLSFSLFYYLENINSRVISIEFYCSICG